MTDNINAESKDLEFRELEVRLDNADDIDDCDRELIEEYLNGEADKLATRILQDLYKIRKIKPLIDREIKDWIKDDENTGAAYRLIDKITKGGD